MKTTALNGQSLLDIALQETGTLDTLFDIAEANGIDVCEKGLQGRELDVPEDQGEHHKDIVDFYRQKNIRPATDTRD